MLFQCLLRVYLSKPPTSGIASSETQHCGIGLFQAVYLDRENVLGPRGSLRCKYVERAFNLDLSTASVVISVRVIQEDPGSLGREFYIVVATIIFKTRVTRGSTGSATRTT